MDTPTHLTAGYLITNILIDLENDDRIKNNRKKWLAWGLICSQVPDLDLIFKDVISSSQRQEHITNGSPHHGELSHYPALYLGLISVGWLILPHEKDVLFALKVFTMNAMAHLVMDSVGMGQGLKWLYPFKQDQMGLDLTHKIGPEDYRAFYLSHRVGYEFLIYFLTLSTIFFKKYRNQFKPSPIE